MRRSLVVMGLLSATVLASVVSPSYSGDLSANPSRDEQSGIRVIRENPGATAKGAPANEGLLRIARADHGDEAHAMRPPRPRGDEGIFPRPLSREDAGRPPKVAPPGELRGHHDLDLDLAARLSALETYVGITSAQLDTWRAYTSSLIDFLESPEPPRDVDREPPPPRPEDATRPSQDAAPFFAERLADAAIVRAEKAKALKQAIDALRSTLSTEQLDRLTRTERPFGRHPLYPPFPGPIEQEADRHGPADERLPPHRSEIDRSLLPEPQLSR